VLSYVLMAAPRTDLKPVTWWFPIGGQVPYKGYFSEDSARTEAERLEREGFDTNIRAAAAYSTLGWFDDPLMAHLLDYDAVTLVEIIFHELLHNTLFVRGNVDFNESLANFVGIQAAIRFFADRNGKASPEYRQIKQMWDDEYEFSNFLYSLTVSLSELYAKDIPIEEKLKSREEIFSRSKKQWTLRAASRPAHRFRYFDQSKLNNAVIADYLLYLSHLDLFQRLLDLQGGDIARMVSEARKALKKKEPPFDAVRDYVQAKAPPQ